MGERYDGKTRRDDIKKYILIAVIVAVAVGAWLLIYNLFGTKNKAADLNVTFVSYGVPSDSAQEQLESFLKETVGDANGDGRTIVRIYYVDFSMGNGDDQMLVQLSESDRALFLLSNQTSAYGSGASERFSEYFTVVDGLDEVMTQVNQTQLFADLGLENFEFYAAVLDRGAGYEEQTALAVDTIKAILATGTAETE
jgi:hypothetical protein